MNANQLSQILEDDKLCSKTLLDSIHFNDTWKHDDLMLRLLANYEELKSQLDTKNKSDDDRYAAKIDEERQSKIAKVFDNVVVHLKEALEGVVIGGDSIRSVVPSYIQHRHEPALATRYYNNHGDRITINETDRSSAAWREAVLTAYNNIRRLSAPEGIQWLKKKLDDERKNIDWSDGRKDRLYKKSYHKRRANFNKYANDRKKLYDVVSDIISSWTFLLAVELDFRTCGDIAEALGVAPAAAIYRLTVCDFGSFKSPMQLYHVDEQKVSHHFANGSYHLDNSVKLLRKAQDAGYLADKLESAVDKMNTMDGLYWTLKSGDASGHTKVIQGWQYLKPPLKRLMLAIFNHYAICSSESREKFISVATSVPVRAELDRIGERDQFDPYDDQWLPEYMLKEVKQSVEATQEAKCALLRRAWALELSATVDTPAVSDVLVLDF